MIGRNQLQTKLQAGSIVRYKNFFSLAKAIEYSKFGKIHVARILITYAGDERWVPANEVSLATFRESVKVRL